MSAATTGVRHRRTCAALVTTLAAGAALLLSCVAGTANAQMASGSETTNAPVLPSSVLLFPPTISTDSGDSAGAGTPLTPSQQDLQRIVTNEMRDVLTRGKIGVVIYSATLPSMQRAELEGVKPDDAKAGPGDDPRKAQHFASIVGASEYITETVADYKYDAGSRTATFNLDLQRFAVDGTPLGTVAFKAVGSAPADVPGAKQEAFADASASHIVALQAIEGVYPQVTAIINPPQTETKKKHGHKFLGGILVPVIAVGAALIAPHI